MNEDKIKVPATDVRAGDVLAAYGEVLEVTQGDRSCMFRTRFGVATYGLRDDVAVDAEWACPHCGYRNPRNLPDCGGCGREGVRP